VFSKTTQNVLKGENMLVRKSCLTRGALLSAVAFILLLCIASAQTERVLFNFTGGTAGGTPLASLIRDKSGNLYGTTNGGGAGFGTVFKLAPNGHETVMYSFKGSPDGASPQAGVVRDAAGNLYGTTGYGGAFGYGIVYKISPTGTETILYTFTGGADGAWPFGGLVLDAQGNLYGGTNGGGASSGGCCGVLYKISPTGTEKVLYTFTGYADGNSPQDRLLRDSHGNLFGTALFGGSAYSLSGFGTVFQLTTAGVYKVLYTFTGGSDGGQSLAELVRDKLGNFYGTTALGGDLSCNGGAGCGVVFKLDSAGNETVLHAFGGGADGINPNLAGVVLDSGENLYGTTQQGGSSGNGTVFEVNSSGTESVLLNFTGSNGASPQISGGLILDSKANLYGTTPLGGAHSAGVIFRLTP
jgi:uncharacterized repeat protein (TIGR03803 family)